MLKVTLAAAALGLAAITINAADAPVTKYFHQAGSGARTQLGHDLQSSFLSTDTAGGFQGMTLGMFARLDPTNSMPQNIRR